MKPHWKTDYHSFQRSTLLFLVRVRNPFFFNWVFDFSRTYAWSGGVGNTVSKLKEPDLGGRGKGGLAAYISNDYTFHSFSVYAVNVQGFHGIPVLTDAAHSKHSFLTWGGWGKEGGFFFGEVDRYLFSVIWLKIIGWNKRKSKSINKKRRNG